jgi:hypothetical protein
MAHWGDELNEEEIERLSRESINQMVRDIPRPLFINKLNQVMWRTESKLALVAIALIVLGGIYGMSNKVTIEGRCHRCTHGEWRVDSYNKCIMLL